MCLKYRFTQFYTADVNSLTIMFFLCLFVPLLNEQVCARFFTLFRAFVGLHLFNLALFWLSRVHTAGLTFVPGSYLNPSQSLSHDLSGLFLGEDLRGCRAFHMLHCSDTLCSVLLPTLYSSQRVLLLILEDLGRVAQRKEYHSSSLLCAFITSQFKFQVSF